MREDVLDAFGDGRKQTLQIEWRRYNGHIWKLILDKDSYVLIDDNDQDCISIKPTDDDWEEIIDMIHQAIQEKRINLGAFFR